MFEDVTTGQTIRIHMSGSTQGLAMRVTYDGTDGAAHHLSGIGVMSEAKFFAYTEDGETWALSNGRMLTKVEEV